MVVQTAPVAEKVVVQTQQVPQDFRNVLENAQQRMKTLHFVLLTIATAGIYYFIHLWKLTGLLEQRFNKQILSKAMLYALVICFGLYGFFDQIGLALLTERSYEARTAAQIFNIISSLFMLAYYVMNIIWAWKARDLLEQYAQSKGISFEMNKILTVILSGYYVNYLANQLAEKEEVLK